MNLRSIVLATALALAGAAASAASYPVTPVAGAAGFWSAPTSSTPAAAGSFTDTFSFGSFGRAVTIDADLSTDSFGVPEFNINFLTATVSNGTTTVVYSLVGEDAFGFEHGNLGSGPVFAAGAPITVTLTGLSGGTASYNGNINFSAAAPVPEPESAALLLAGLGAVGWLARRRLNKSGG